MKFLILNIFFINFLFSQDSIYIDFNSSNYVSKSAIPSNDIEPEYFRLFINNDSIVIDSKGNCKKLHFTLNVDKNCVIESIEYFQSNPSIVYFQIVENDFDAAGSKIIKYDIKNRKELWARPTGGFNVRSFIIYGDNIFLNSIGFIGKMNKNSGKYIWRHEDLYEKYKANHFENVIIRNNTIEGLIYRDINNIWKLIFDQKTGKVLNTIKKGVKANTTIRLI